MKEIYSRMVGDQSVEGYKTQLQYGVDGDLIIPAVVVFFVAVCGLLLYQFIRKGISSG